MTGLCEGAERYEVDAAIALALPPAYHTFVQRRTAASTTTPGYLIFSLTPEAAVSETPLASRIY